MDAHYELLISGFNDYRQLTDTSRIRFVRRYCPMETIFKRKTVG